MSGICAVWRRDRPEQVSETLAAVNGGLLLDASERVGELSASGIGLGDLGSLRHAADVSGPTGDDRLRRGS